MQYTAGSPAAPAIIVTPCSLLEAFATIPDPRRAQGRRFSLPAMLTLAVAAIVANHCSVLAIAEWGRRQSPALLQALGFPHGVSPCQSTIHRLFARLDPAAVNTALQHAFDPKRPMELRPRGSQGVALDGKAHCGRLKHGAIATHPVHQISAFCHDLGIVLSQLVVSASAHEGELTVASTLIRQIDWHGRVLTGDSLYCQRTLCTQVCDAGGDYLIIVKANQPTLLADIKQVFAPLTAEERARIGVHTVHPLPYTSYHSVEKEHGRIEERSIQVSSALADYHDWPYIQQVFAYTRTWYTKRGKRTKTLYGITSLPAAIASAMHVAQLKRGHWQIENRLHYVKDVVLGEDASQIHHGHGADVMALLRSAALSVLRRAGNHAIASQLRYYSGNANAVLSLLGIPMIENA